MWSARPCWIDGHPYPLHNMPTAREAQPRAGLLSLLGSSSSEGTKIPKPRAHPLGAAVGEHCGGGAHEAEGPGSSRRPVTTLAALTGAESRCSAVFFILVLTAEGSEAPWVSGTLP